MVYKAETKKKSGSKAGDILVKVLIVIFAGVFVFSGYKIVTAMTSYNESKESYSDLEQYVAVDIKIPDEPVEPEPGQQQEPEKKERVSPYKYLQEIGADFDKLGEINPDVVSWITISGTKLNYPVVQGEDNEYYLRHLFQGGYNTGGCVFLDIRNKPDFTSRHSILYGHRMDDGSMFTCIQNYKKQSYYDSHPYGLLLTPDGNYVVEFFAGYVTSVNGDAWKANFSSDESFEEWIAAQIEKSDFTASFTPTSSDRVLTLSTCSKTFNNARYVLHGVIRDREG